MSPLLRIGHTIPFIDSASGIDVVAGAKPTYCVASSAASAHARAYLRQRGRAAGPDAHPKTRMGTFTSLKEYRSSHITLDRTGTVVSSTTNRKRTALTGQSDHPTMTTPIPASCSTIPGLDQHPFRVHRQMRPQSLPRVESNDSWATFLNGSHRLEKLRSYSSCSAHSNVSI
jgi:hypothetical protein